MTEPRVPHRSRDLPLQGDEAMRELLSRLVDGDCDVPATQKACALWRDDGQARATWHEYHLIGDLLRSDDVARDPRGDAAFLAAVSGRLSQEPPVVVSVASAEVARAHVWVRPRNWSIPVAAAAGLVAIIGVAVLVRSQPGTEAGVPTMAAVPVSAPGDATMIRDARIDLYLQAHHGMSTRAAAATPGGALRNVDVLLPSR